MNGNVGLGRRAISEGSASVVRAHYARAEGHPATSPTTTHFRGTDGSGETAREARHRPPIGAPDPAGGHPPLDQRVVKASYVQGEVLPGGETQTIEFKSGLERTKGGSSEAAAVRIVKDKAVRYICAFLNSAGGAILFGVEDDGEVSGCVLSEEEKVQITKAIDTVVQGIDPQVEVGAVQHWFTPVHCDEPNGTATSVVVETYVILVKVRPESARLQPVYYPTPHAADSWIRRCESVFALTPALIGQREDEFRSQGRAIRRTWRHISRKIVDFDGHIESLMSGITVPRIELIRAIAGEVLDGDESPRSRTVAVVGDAGTGKTAFIASIVNGGRHKHKEVGPCGWRNLAICGWFFCGANASSEDEVEARAFVGHVAASLLTSPYTKAFRRFVQANSTEVLRVIEASDPRTAFRGLLRLLQTLPGHKSDRRLVFCVDGIDEAAALTASRITSSDSTASTSSTDFITIPDLIFDLATEAPPWLIFLVTTRLQNQLPPGIGNVAADIGAEQDVISLISERRSKDSHLAELLTEDAAKHLAKAAGSSFQFVHSVLELMDGHRWGSGELSQLLPSTDAGNENEQNNAPDSENKLSGLYKSLFLLQFPTASKLRTATQILELLLTARRPLLGSDIVAALDADFAGESVREALNELQAYLTQVPNSSEENLRLSWTGTDVSVGADTTLVRLQHLSFRQWLLDSRNPLLTCNLTRGHSRLAMQHLSQAHAISTTVFLNKHFPPGSDAWKAGKGSSIRGASVLQEQEGIFHVLEAAVHLGQAFSEPDADASVVGALRDLSGPSLVGVDAIGRTAMYFATRQANKAEYLAALRFLLAATREHCASLPLEAGLQGKCPLVLAAHRGHTEAFALLVQAVDDAVENGSIEPEDAEEALDAALWAAASAGAVGCAKLLVDKGSDLSVALQRGIVMGPEASNRDKPCPIVDAKGRSALWLAVSSGNTEVVRVLLEHPPATNGTSYADLAAFDSSSCDVPASPLHLAIGQGNSEIVRLLLDNASKCLSSQTKGEQWPTLPMCRASALGHTACLEELLRHSEMQKAINCASSFRPHRTALLEAVWHVKVDCVETLLNAPNIDVLVAEQDGGTALHEACYWGKGRSSFVASHLGATKIVDMLILYHQERGISLDTPDADGCTPLSFAAAAEGDQSGWVSMLLNGGALPHTRPWGGAKALGLRKATSTSINLTAQPWGGTPLEETATRGNVAVVATLCAAITGEFRECSKETGFFKEANAIVDAAAPVAPGKRGTKTTTNLTSDILEVAKIDAKLKNAFLEKEQPATGTPIFADQKHGCAPTIPSNQE